VFFPAKTIAVSAIWLALTMAGINLTADLDSDPTSSIKTEVGEYEVAWVTEVFGVELAHVDQVRVCLCVCMLCVCVCGIYVFVVLKTEYYYLIITIIMLNHPLK